MNKLLRYIYNNNKLTTTNNQLKMLDTQASG